MAFVNATDSSATALGATSILGPQNFQDLFSANFQVGKGNSDTTRKDNVASQTQTAPTLSGFGGADDAMPLNKNDALLPDMPAISSGVLAAGAGALALLVLVMVAMKRHS